MSISEETKAKRIAVRTKLHAERILINDRWFHPNANHGTSAGYITYGCRCQHCLETEKERYRARNAAWTRQESAAIDTYARSIPNRTPIPTADLQLAAYIREGAAA